MRKPKAKPKHPDNPISFREFVDQVRPGYRWYAHCVKTAAVLQRVADDDLRRVMIFEPPRHGKSEQVSRLFPAYYLYRHPDRWVGLNSYAAELAYTFSRAAREHYLRSGGALRDDAAAVKHWQTLQGGGLWAAGVGGPITGKGYHLGIIDDPLKNSEEAASEKIRAKHKEWYGSTFYTREEPGGAQIIIQTRWHEDDLSGWLLAEEAQSAKEIEEEDGDPDDTCERWHIVHFPAIKEPAPEFPPTCSIEPDDRAEGDPLCPERYPLKRLQKLAKRIGEYFWNALFQQRPRPREGGMFKRDWFRVLASLPRTHTVDGEEQPIRWTWVRYWDKAGTEGGGAWTAGVLMGRGSHGRFVVADVVRGQWSAGEREKRIRRTTEADAQQHGQVTVWVEQEPGSGGLESAEATLRNLAGYSAHKEPVTGDKATRAEPYATQAEALNVDLLAGDWNGRYLDELTAFPNGTYKDQVDGSSGAFNKLAKVKRKVRVLDDD